MTIVLDMLLEFDHSVWGKGLGTEITQIVLQYAFEELKLHRVDLRVIEYNQRAIACYEKCGFVKEGIEREGALIEDNYETDVMMSILDREYKAIQDTFIKMNLLLTGNDSSIMFHNVGCRQSVQKNGKSELFRLQHQAARIDRQSR